MDPITALNQEFARLVQEDWSREAAEGPSGHAALTQRKSVAVRLRAMIGAAVVTFGLWLQGQQAGPAINHAQPGR